MSPPRTEVMCQCSFFFFNDTATTEIYTLSLHDALPIWEKPTGGYFRGARSVDGRWRKDRKSTRLNSSHGYISYAVFCLKKQRQPTELLAQTGPNTARSGAPHSAPPA